jgi:hypothetical protein
MPGKRQLAKFTGGKDAGKKAVGKIESGWEFKEDAQDQVAEIKSADRITAKVLTKQGLKNQGLNQKSRPEPG